MEQEGGRDRSAFFCDTNVLVRLLSGAPTDQAEAAERVLDRADLRIVLTDVVIAELTFVMTGIGKYSRVEIAEAIGELIESPSVLVADEAVVRDALELWSSTPRLHFVDAYLSALNRRTAGSAVLSFDRDFDGLDAVERVDPRTY